VQRDGRILNKNYTGKRREYMVVLITKMNLSIPDFRNCFSFTTSSPFKS